jgi:hypothetical protein
LFCLAVGAFIALYVPFNLGFNTNLVIDAADELIFAQYNLVSPTTVDILRLSIPISNLCLFKELNFMVLLMKKSIKWLIFKYYHQPNDQVLLI